MAAAVGDHDGGEPLVRGMAMSRGGEIATPVDCDLDSAAEGIEQQAAIAALHHGVAQAHEPHRAIAQVMGFPAALGHAVGAEKGFGDVAMACLLEPPVKRAQRERQAIAPGGGKHRRVAPQRALCQSAPQPERSRRADLEQLIERQDDAWDLLAKVFEDVQAKQIAPPFDQPLRSIFCEEGFKR